MPSHIHHRHLHSFGLLVVLFGVVTPATAAPTAAATRTDGAAAQISPTSVEQLAAQAAKAFREGRFESSLSIYREAAKIATHPSEQAALRMNMGACLVELGRLAEAKQAFLDAAQTDAGIASKARLNAALVAVELGRLDEAEAQLKAAAPADESLKARQTEIRTRIAELRNEGTRRKLLENIEGAAKAIRDEQWPVAARLLTEAESHFEAATASERVDVLHGLATTQLALDRPNEAQNTLGRALELAPKDPELHYALARTHEAVGEEDAAQAEYLRSLDLGLQEPQAKSARAHIASLDRLSPSEWFGWLSLGGGYDSNPRQSGAAAETTLGSRGRGGTAYGRFTGELGRTQRVHDRLSLRLRYSGDFWGLAKETVQDLSIQNHGLYAGAQWVPTTRAVLNFEIGPSITYVGLSSPERFLWDFLGSVKARYHASRVRTWRASFDARAITGATGWEFLSGSRLDAELSHGWFRGPLDLRLGLRGRLHTMGTRASFVDATVMPACANTCDGAEYRIPLSYTGLGPVGSARITVVDSLHLALTTQFDWRRYRDESYIVGIGSSRKRRVDLRYSLGVDVQWALDQNGHFVVVPSYALLLCSSNVQQSSTDSTHHYDYDDRSFAQHFFELGIEASF